MTAPGFTQTQRSSHELGGFVKLVCNGQSWGLLRAGSINQGSPQGQFHARESLVLLPPPQAAEQPSSIWGLRAVPRVLPAGRAAGAGAGRLDAEGCAQRCSGKGEADLAASVRAPSVTAGAAGRRRGIFCPRLYPCISRVAASVRLF